MPATVNVTSLDATQQGVIVEGTLTLSGNYPTGGDTVNFLSNAQIPSESSPRVPVQLTEQPASGSTPSGFFFWLIQGTTAANWLLFIATASGQPVTQLGAGAYPAALTAAGFTLAFRAFFPYGV